MKRFKSFFRKLLIVFGIITIAGVAWLTWFFVANEAPILMGDVIHHVTYKNNLTLDIYQPTDTVYDKNPVVVFFHGGAWIMGIKESININRFNEAINRLRQQGYAVISPEYTLADNGKSPFPDCIIDARDVLVWIKNNAEIYHFDLQNVGLFGESAGAHIALMTALASGDSLRTQGLSINYVVDVYGPTDLDELSKMPVLDSLNLLLSKVPEPIRESLDITHSLFGFDPKGDATLARDFALRFSPVSYIQSNPPPILIIHGQNDRIVPATQSMGFASKLESHHAHYEMHVLPGVDHALRKATPQQKEAIQGWIVNFVLENYNAQD